MFQASPVPCSFSEMYNIYNRVLQAHKFDSSQTIVKRFKIEDNNLALKVKLFPNISKSLLQIDMESKNKIASKRPTFTSYHLFWFDAQTDIYIFRTQTGS